MAGDDAIREAQFLVQGDDVLRAARAAILQEPGAAFQRYPGVTVWPGDGSHLAAVVIDAVRPLIEADLRERLAAAIEALPPENATGSRDFGRGYASAVRDAARMVRERP